MKEIARREGADDSHVSRILNLTPLVLDGYRRCQSGRDVARGSDTVRDIGLQLDPMPGLAQRDMREGQRVRTAVFAKYTTCEVMDSVVTTYARSVLRDEVHFMQVSKKVYGIGTSCLSS